MIEPVLFLPLKLVYNKLLRTYAGSSLPIPIAIPLEFENKESSEDTENGYK